MAQATSGERIISLAPALTELLFSVGAGDQIVGTMSFSDHPPAARAIEVIGSYSGIDQERIVALRPDWVIAWSGGTPATWIAQLRRLGLRVHESEVTRLSDIAGALRDMGALSGHERQAAEAAATVARRLADLARRYARPTPVRVFYQVWRDPLMTINGRHVIADALRTCGARGVFDAHAEAVPTISREAVVAARPAAIVTAVADAGPTGDTGPADRRDPLADWRRFTQLPAVRNGQLIVLDADLMSRPTMRMLDGVEQLCQALASVTP